ncbi:PREDICTED: uncharacterized protein C16orf59 homolog, partial [Merops nubicus]|uniref:uncharacterized protein C16orf59 homolog n=1 Tax=Merops nubicus TaxID=57421 RepID=UPI0004F00FB4
NRPSPKELEELELLNRALEKALKVRKSILKTPLEAQGATGEKSASEGSAPKNAEEQPVPVAVEDIPESTKELKDLFALKLQVSMLHQEVALQKVMMAELLPLLEPRLCPEASAAQLYRALYAQLCEGGRRFPVLVRDELPA